jgi:hypothetical protein
MSDSHNLNTFNAVCRLLGVPTDIRSNTEWADTFFAALEAGKSAEQIAAELSNITARIERAARENADKFEKVCARVGLSPRDAADDYDTRNAIAGGLRSGLSVEDIAARVAPIAAGAVERLGKPVSVSGMFTKAAKV